MVAAVELVVLGHALLDAEHGVAQLQGRRELLLVARPPDLVEDRPGHLERVPPDVLLQRGGALVRSGVVEDDLPVAVVVDRLREIRLGVDRASDVLVRVDVARIGHGELAQERGGRRVLVLAVDAHERRRSFRTPPTRAGTPGTRSGRAGTTTPTCSRRPDSPSGRRSARRTPAVPPASSWLAWLCSDASGAGAPLNAADDDRARWSRALRLRRAAACEHHGCEQRCDPVTHGQTACHTAGRWWGRAGRGSSRAGPGGVAARRAAVEAEPAGVGPRREVRSAAPTQSRRRERIVPLGGSFVPRGARAEPARGTLFPVDAGGKRSVGREDRRMRLAFTTPRSTLFPLSGKLRRTRTPSRGAFDEMPAQRDSRRPDAAADRGPHRGPRTPGATR